MGILQQREQSQSKSPSPAPEAAADKKAPRPEDLVPPENKVAQAGTGDAKDAAAAKDGKAPATTAPKSADEKKAEDERKAAVTAKWEGLLGKWLGGQLAKIVLEEVSVDKLNGYVKDGLKSAGPALGDALKGQVKPTEAQAAGLKSFSDALAGVMTGLVDNWVQSEAGQKVLTKISHWVQDNPGWVMGIVGTALIGGAIAAWFANPDIDIKIPLGLGKDWKATAGLDLGKLQELGFQGASLVVANKNQSIKLAAEVKNKEEKNDAGEVTKKEKSGKLEVGLGKKEAEHMTFVMNGSIVETKDGLVAHTLGGSLDLVDPKTGAKITIGRDGKWDSRGNKEDAFSYSASVGKDVTGSFTCNLKNATVVDKEGNIINLSSQELKVAVGDKANKFAGSIGQKQESKDGKTTTTTTLGASMKGQLGPGALFETDGNVAITEDKVVVKLGGKLTAKVGGKDIELDGNYQTDGAVQGKIKIGKGDEYKIIQGEKKGETITFSTKDVFKGGSLEKKTTTDTKTGKQGEQTTATADLNKNTKLTMSGGSEGSKVGLDTKIGDATTLKGHVGTDAAGNAQGGLGLKYDTETVKFFLDAEMSKGKSTFGAGTSINTAEGFKFDASLKLDETRLTEVGVKLGYKDPAAFRTFLVGYKREWMKENQQYADKFDLMLEYSLGKFQTRFQAGMDLHGGKLAKTNLDLSGAYQINKDWKAVGGLQMSGVMNNDTNRLQQNFTPYVGAQYGNVQVIGKYDVNNKAFSVGLGLSF